MNTSNNRPNVDAALAPLKDFQRRTVDYAFRRLYLDADCTDRFLIADEVGLGKTLVARGLIAKTIDHLWNDVPRIDVIYICSNSSIARQNLNRLRVEGVDESPPVTRITLLPTELHSLNSSGRRVNLISLTPGTSFELKRSTGMMDERALLFCMLRDYLRFEDSRRPYNVFRDSVGMDRFKRCVLDQVAKPIEQSIHKKFIENLEIADQKCKETGQLTFRKRMNQLCEGIGRVRYIENIDPQVHRERIQFIGELRNILAQSCLRALEPDLIILDEFQRFKDLIDPDSEEPAAELARQLFDYTANNTRAKVILLSATPYKMYTLTSDALAGEDHYRDFLTTLQFLEHGDSTRSEDFKKLLDEYRRELYQLHAGDKTRLNEIKLKMEKQLRRVMTRTERLATSLDRNGMLREHHPAGVTLDVADAIAYAGIVQIAETLKFIQPEVDAGAMEYWKSAPYLLNFMDDGYKLKEAFKKAIDEESELNPQLARAFRSHPELLLDWNAVENYAALAIPNGRLRNLVHELLDSNLWKLLWLPPSLPYYEPAGVFVDAAKQSPTKRLIFSNWKVVPKVIATITSYEVERRIMLTQDAGATNQPKQRQQKLLRITREYDDNAKMSLVGLSLFSLLYPSISLAKAGDPLHIALESGSRSLDKAQVLGTVKESIWQMLQTSGLLHLVEKKGTEDERWYWATPMLLDRKLDPNATSQWFMQESLATIWSGNPKPSEDDSAWAEHVDAIKALNLDLGKPPADLLDVLAQMALASPAVCVLRSLQRGIHDDKPSLSHDAMNAAAQIGYAFRTFFNNSEVTALIRGLKDKGDDRKPYWKQVLDYCGDGNLQAVMDEFGHVVKENLGLTNKSPEQAMRDVAGEFVRVLTLRTATPSVDVISVSTKVRMNQQRMRNHIAARFGSTEVEDTSEPIRDDQVRAAFNSPFWPFILASTSIGQEGLDFHPYCHAVVHWNLPSNPVDMEQREGRVHRYKGHAVRKNLARVHGLQALNSAVGDPWQALFDFAADHRHESGISESDIYPYWVFPCEDGVQIERHVPALPLSRDVQRLADLRKTLAAYRMTFGQSRQEELVDYLTNQLDEERVKTLSDSLRINLEPPDPLADVPTPVLA